MASRYALLAGAVVMIAPIASAQTVEGGAGAAVEEVVVTAQRREERLQDVPLSITAITGAQLAASGVPNMRNLTQLTPGLFLSNNGAFVQPTIRGVGSRGTSAGDSSNVALYIDGVYQPTQTGNFIEFPNVERVEVLKGPQGSLYGRNATGGAIIVTTKDPSFQPSGKVTAAYGSFNERRLEAYVTAPITDQVAANLSLLGRRFDGYATNTGFAGKKVGGLDFAGARAKLLYKPSNRFSLLLTGFYTNSMDNQGLATKSVDGKSAAQRTFPNTKVATARDEVSFTFTPFDKTQNYGGSLRAVGDLGFATLTSVTGHQKTKTYLHTDSDVTPADVAALLFYRTSYTYTQELYVTSNGSGPFAWTAGISGLWDKAGDRPNISLANNVPTTVYGWVHTKAIAPYAEVTYKLTDQLSLIGGLRYNSETKTGYNFRYNAANILLASLPYTRLKWTNTSYRATAKYEFSPELNVYLTTNSGFKSGAFNPTVAILQAVVPETVTAYEAGFKSTPLPRTTLNGAVYWYDYKNIQIQRANSPLTGGTVIENAASARIKGAELSATTVFSDNWSGRLGLAYTDAKYRRFPFASDDIPQPDGRGGNLDVSVNANGKRMLKAPKLTASAGLTFAAPLMAGQFRGTASVFHSSTVYFNPSNTLKQKAYNVANLDAAWTAPGDQWTVGVWAENLFDAHYVLNDLYSATAYTKLYARPRSVGARISYQWE